MARGRRSTGASDAEADVPAPEAELEVLAAGLKAWASNHCTETLRACREACGGQGYLAENRFAALKADTDVFTTFEGANDVLYQLAAKGLLSRFREEVTSLDLRGIVRYLSERAETSLTELNPVVTRRTDEAHLLDPSLHRAALEYREARLLRSVAERMRSRIREGTDSFDAVNEVQDHLIALARAHVERVVLEAFQCPSASGRPVRVVQARGGSGLVSGGRLPRSGEVAGSSPTGHEALPRGGRERPGARRRLRRPGGPPPRARPTLDPALIVHQVPV
jgi:hypothetical protein